MLRVHGCCCCLSSVNEGCECLDTWLSGTQARRGSCPIPCRRRLGQRVCLVAPLAPSRQAAPRSMQARHTALAALVRASPRPGRRLRPGRLRLSDPWAQQRRRQQRRLQQRPCTPRRRGRAPRGASQGHLARSDDARLSAHVTGRPAWRRHSRSRQARYYPR